VQHYGPPAATLTGNGMVCTTRLPGGTGGRNAFAHQLRRQGIKQNNGRPGHPQTQGKAGRVQQTPKNWLAAQPVQPADQKPGPPSGDSAPADAQPRGDGDIRPALRAGQHDPGSQRQPLRGLPPLSPVL